MTKNSSIYTKAVHAGTDKREHFGAVSVPVYNSSLFAFEDADEGAAVHNLQKPGYFYGKLGNPTQNALEKTIAELELTDDAIAMASGMAAISASVMAFVRPGDHMIALSSMYSTTNSLLSYLEEHFGIEVTYVAANDTNHFEDAIRPSTKIIWIESPSNPRLNIIDIEPLTKLAKDRGILTIADNTFATPFNQNPIALGVDLVIHSATKYLGGHSDVTAGVVAGSNPKIEKIRNSTNKYFGGSISPQAAWLVMRGIKTLALRMRQHNDNAYAVAHMLSKQPKIKEVFYPGLESHELHETAAKQMNGFGGMVSFDVGGYRDGRNFMNALELIAIATSLGGVESIAQHSASMTHAMLTVDKRAKAGISEGLIRFSVGIESYEDIERDLLAALEKI
jgi:methionine-gamma-lyase